MENSPPVLLYDLHEIKEWEPVEEEEVRISRSFSLLNFVPGYGKKEIGLKLPTWELKISTDETRFAILSSSFVEIYSVPDKLLGRSKFFEEPMSRQIVWSRNSDYFLLPSYNGKRFYLYDGFSAHIIYMVSSPTYNNSVSSFLFVDFLGPLTPHSAWEDTLLSISDKGKGSSLFSIGKTGFKELTLPAFNLKHVCAAVFSKKYNLLIIAHWDSSAYVLGVWRPLKEEPYFMKMETYTDEGSDVHPIQRISLSHCQSKILTLDSEGTIKIYQIPTLSLLFMIPLEEQPLFDEMNPVLLQDPKLSARKNDFLNSNIKWHPYKVEWWDNNAVIISRYSGSVSIITVESGKESRNLLGDSVEFFSDIPCITHRFGKYILCLERDYEEPQEDEGTESQSKGWFWSFSDKGSCKRIISNYRLIAMVKMTPEELYQRKIDKEEYGEALVLADVFGLDSDLVYLRRWHLSDYSVNALNDFLYKITKASTITKECIETVPNNIHDAKELLQFGLKTTQTQKDESELEKKFERYISLLKTFERLLRCFSRQEIRFNARFFTTFRDSSIEESIRKFAQLGYWDAIRVLFEMHFEEISEVYIQLLSNIPESYSPLEYSFILPFANFKTKEVIYPFISGKEKLSYESLLRWYHSRSLAIEEAMGLPDNSIDLLNFAKLHGIEVDPELLQDLSTLRTLIYGLKKHRLNYSHFKKMSNPEKVEEFIMASTENGESVLVSSRIQEYLLPFLENQEALRKGSYNAILKEYFSRSRPRDLTVDKEIIFNLPERRVRDHEFIALCLDSLFKFNDEYEILCEVLSLFMEHSGMAVLQEVYTIMNINLITKKYGYSKSMEIDSQDYKDVKYIDSVIEDLSRNINFLQHIESPDLGFKALDDVFTVCKCNASMDLNTVFKSTLIQLLRSENGKIVSLLGDCLGCCGGVVSCECFYHKALRHYALVDLSSDEKEGILLSTAEYYFQASNFMGDHNVSLAECCLKQVPSPQDNPRVKRMKEVLKAGYLLHEFALQLPLSTIMEAENAKGIVLDLLKQNKNNYKKHSQILMISSLLSPQEEGRSVEAMIAEHALNLGDLRTALTLVRKMILHCYEPCGELCFQILQLAPHLSVEDREALHDFCLHHGRPEHLLALLDEDKRRKDLIESANANKRDYELTFDKKNPFVVHPFYDEKPRMYEHPSPWTLVNKAINEDSLQSWVFHLLNYDTLCAISLLTALEGKNFMNIMEDTDEKNILFIKAYVVSIQAFSSLLREDTILLSPQNLIAAAVQESKSLDEHPIHSVMSRFNNYIEARRLIDIDANIDVIRFVNEESYKIDTILGLSMSSDVHSFNLAMSYVSKNDSIDTWELCQNFLRSLFDDDPSSVQHVLENNPKVVKILCKDTERLNESLKKYIYQSLSGQDYDGLILYFRLQVTLGLLTESKLKLYKKLIMKCKALNASKSDAIDIKSLLGDSDSLRATLKVIIDSSSLSKVQSLTEILAQVNPFSNTGIEPYRSLCEKYLETGVDKGLSIEQIFEQCEEHLRKMCESGGSEESSQLKEFVEFVTFKSPRISLPFSDREAFFHRLRDLLPESNDSINSLLESLNQFNSELRDIHNEDNSLPSDLFFDLGMTLGDKDEIRALLLCRMVDGRSSYKDLLPVIYGIFSADSSGQILKEALSNFLSLEDHDRDILASLLSDYDALIMEEADKEAINGMLIDWCMNSKETGIKDTVIDFVRKKSEDKESLGVVVLHKSRLILSDKFVNVEELLPNLNDKETLLQRLMDEVMTGDNASAILELICFWEEEEENETEDAFLMRGKERILNFIIQEGKPLDFLPKLSTFSLNRIPDLRTVLKTCYKKEEVRFAFEIMKHCAGFNADMRDAVRVLGARYPLTLGKRSHGSKPLAGGSDYPAPFSLWLKPL